MDLQGKRKGLFAINYQLVVVDLVDNSFMHSYKRTMSMSYHLYPETYLYIKIKYVCISTQVVL